MYRLTSLALYLKGAQSSYEGPIAHALWDEWPKKWHSNCPLVLQFMMPPTVGTIKQCMHESATSLRIGDGWLF